MQHEGQTFGGSTESRRLRAVPAAARPALRKELRDIGSEPCAQAVFQRKETNADKAVLQRFGAVKPDATLAERKGDRAQPCTFPRQAPRACLKPRPSHRRWTSPARPAPFMSDCPARTSHDWRFRAVSNLRCAKPPPRIQPSGTLFAGQRAMIGTDHAPERAEGKARRPSWRAGVRPVAFRDANAVAAGRGCARERFYRVGRSTHQKRTSIVAPAFRLWLVDGLVAYWAKAGHAVAEPSRCAPLHDVVAPRSRCWTAPRPPMRPHPGRCEGRSSFGAVAASPTRRSRAEQ